MMLALGLIIAVAIGVRGERPRVLRVPLADMLIIVLGVLLLMNRNPFKALPQLRVPAPPTPLRQRVRVRSAVWADCAALFGAAGRRHLCALLDGG